MQVVFFEIESRGGNLGGVVDQWLTSQDVFLAEYENDVFIDQMGETRRYVAISERPFRVLIWRSTLAENHDGPQWSDEALFFASYSIDETPESWPGQSMSKREFLNVA